MIRCSSYLRIAAVEKLRVVICLFKLGRWMGGGQCVSNINFCVAWQEFCNLMSKSADSRSSSISIFFRDMEIIIRRNREWTWVVVVAPGDQGSIGKCVVRAGGRVSQFLLSPCDSLVEIKMQDKYCP